MRINNTGINDLLQPFPTQAIQGGPLVNSSNRPMLERIQELEARATNHENSAGKAIEELYMRISELERLVRG